MSTPPTPPPSSGSPATPPGAIFGAAPHDLFAVGLPTEPPAPASPPPTLETLAPEFPRLELLALIGQGGMGAVYRARQRDLGRDVALKVLRPGLDADPAFAERFTREARALAQLNHPGIVTLHDHGRTPAGRYYILMEFVDGLNLRQLLAAGRLAPREALAIIPPLCDALQYAHDRGVVHRDIKPENLLIDRLGRVKVADFGLARLLADPTPPGDSAEEGPVARLGSRIELTAADRVMGTPAYMAPEQRSRPGEVDHRADLYALGVVLYQMLTGELPSADALRPPSQKILLDVRLDAIVLRALQHDPALRYPAAREFKTDVETAVERLSTSYPAPTPIPAPSPEASTRPDSWLGTLGLLYVVTGWITITTNWLPFAYAALRPESVPAGEYFSVTMTPLVLLSFGHALRHRSRVWWGLGVLFGICSPAALFTYWIIEHQFAPFHVFSDHGVDLALSPWMRGLGMFESILASTVPMIVGLRPILRRVRLPRLSPLAFYPAYALCAALLAWLWLQHQLPYVKPLEKNSSYVVMPQVAPSPSDTRTVQIGLRFLVVPADLVLHPGYDADKPLETIFATYPPGSAIIRSAPLVTLPGGATATFAVAPSAGSAPSTPGLSARITPILKDQRADFEAVFALVDPLPDESGTKLRKPEYRRLGGTALDAPLVLSLPANGSHRFFVELRFSPAP